MQSEKTSSEMKVQDQMDSKGNSTKHQKKKKKKKLIPIVLKLFHKNEENIRYPNSFLRPPLP